MAEERPSPSSIHDHPDGTTPAVPQSPDAEVEPVLALPRKRDPQWSEVHDPFDTTPAAVDPRASGDPIGPEVLPVRPDDRRHPADA